MSCPSCGYCPHCGRGGYYHAPYYWQGPTWTTGQWSTATQNLQNSQTLEDFLRKNIGTQSQEAK